MIHAFQTRISIFNSIFKNIVGNKENVGYKYPLVSLNDLTHYHTMTHFDALKMYSCGKHCEKKEKLLVTSNFSFSYFVFYPIKALIFHLK